MRKGLNKSNLWQDRQQNFLKQLKVKQQRLLNTLVEEQTSNLTTPLLSSLDSPGLTKSYLLADLRLNKPSKQLNQFSQESRIDSSNPLLESLPTTQVVPPTETIPIAVNAASTGSQKEQTLPLPSSLDISNPTLLTSFPIQIYQVQAGDTIDAIAHRYGISSTEIIEINQINNPSLLQVDDRLKIPVHNLANKALLNNNSLSSATRFEDDRQLTKAHFPKQKNFSTKNFPVNFPVNKSASTDRSIAINNLIGSRGDRSQPSTDPYLANLREDVVALQQEYQRQSSGVQLISSKAGDLQTNSSSPLLDPPSPEASAVILSKLKSNSSEKRAAFSLGDTNSLSKSITTPDLLSDRHISSILRSRSVLGAKSPQTLLSSAPTIPNNYNPALKLPTEVLPDLPPLSSPDRYLPGDPTRFNGYMWPAKGKLSSGFGRRWGKMHKGIDIAAPIGTPIYAAASGEVVSAGWNSGGYGNLVKLKHADGSITFYAHNSKVIVSTGQNIKQGQQIAEMGSTGFSTGSHLHFEIHPSGKGAVNPIALLPKSRESKL